MEAMSDDQQQSRVLLGEVRRWELEAARKEGDGAPQKPSTACKNGLLWKCLADSCRFRLVLCDNLSMNVVGDELILQLAFVHCFSYVLHFARQNSTPSPLLKAVSLATNLFFISFVNRGLSG